MKEIEETSENFLHIKVRTFIAIVGSLVIGTNVVNSVISDIIENRDKIQYNEEAENRRRSHLEEKMNYKIIINDLKEDIELLEEKLENCKDDNK